MKRLDRILKRRPVRVQASARWQENLWGVSLSAGNHRLWNRRFCSLRE
ncbi:MAG: hypothetical protein JEZ12_06075 [Desulfobacterium sp.]|nr:hypothetical protein [Desulfobacterium sp.]